jgi:hypothetical protein
VKVDESSGGVFFIVLLFLMSDMSDSEVKTSYSSMVLLCEWSSKKGQRKLEYNQNLGGFFYGLLYFVVV